MNEATGLSSTLNRTTTKSSEFPQPHYYNAFQNYCCGPRCKTETLPSNKDFLIIPDKIKLKANEILRNFNPFLLQRLNELTPYTSVLPYQYFLELDPQNDIQRYLIDRPMLKTMTDAQVINWVSSIKKLYPVRTSGNGNCLLHAVLIAMIGIHDFDLHLRNQLVQFMDKAKQFLKANWRAERLKTDKIYGIQSEESKLDNEWEELCDLVRYENTDDGQTTSNLQFLEGVHIFSISNMLRRPIIILSEDVVRNKHGEAISYNDLFGIYLPTYLKPKECIQNPIVLAYDQSHFCPLQVVERQMGLQLENYLPLYQSVEHAKNQTLLPIRFLNNDKPSTQNMNLLQNYLKIKKLSFLADTNSSPLPIYCAELGNRRVPEKDNFFLLYYNYLIEFFETQKRKSQDENLQDNFYPNQSINDSNQRQLITFDSSLSPPPSYATATMRSTNDNRNNIIYERRPSYDKAVANGTSFVQSNEINRSINQYSDSFNQTRPTQRSSINQDDYYYNSKSQWDSNIDDLMSNEKLNNNSNSKFKQEQQFTRTQIPVQIHKSDLSGNLIDFNQRTDKLRPCIVCKHLFNDISSTSLCSECNRTKLQPIFSTVPRQSPPTRYGSSDFLTQLSISRTGSQRILCAYCRSLNLINSPQPNSIHFCSRCRKQLPYR